MAAWTEKDPIVYIKDVHKSFGKLEVLKGVSMDVMKGEVVCIIGPSGSGKSTLIRCINALNDIQGGSYQIYAGHYHSGSIDHYEDTKQQLADFVSTVEHNGKLLRSVLKDKRSQGLKCYVFGASTKGNTMLQIWQLADLFEGAAEIHSGKIGRYTVGTNIPIVEEQLALEHADVLFVPNFGFKDLFIEKLDTWIRSGGQLLFAMPTVEVIDESSLTMHT